MWRRRRVTAVVLAAGNGSRMGVHENKMYHNLGGEPLLFHTLKAFDQHPAVDELVLTVRAEEMAQMEALLISMAPKKPYRLVLGGKTRQDSVRLALEVVKNPVVIVHDGARPFILAQHITACLEALRHYQGAILALPLEDSIFLAPRKRLPKILDAPLFAVQTPQCFYTKTLRSCHEKHAMNPSITDDSRLLELEGYPVGVVMGDPGNFKVTTPLDLLLAQAHA